MNERDWIPAHRRLFKGAKKGWPRAVRFVFLELCHEARVTNGVLEFPPDWDTLTAVHDRIGGDRKEIRKALTILQIPDATGAQVVQIERDATEHRLKIVKWESWVGPKSAAERMQTHRERIVKIPNASRADSGVTPTGKDSREQERETRAREAEVREEPPSVVRLKSVPPLPPDPPEATPQLFSAPPSVTQQSGLPTSHHSEDAALGNLGGGGGAASGESGYDLASRVWHELWSAKYKRPYEQSGTRLTGAGSEESVLIDVGGRALIRGDHAEPYLRHKISQYLRDEGDRKWLAEHCHPLRTLTRDWAKYGEPKEPKRMVPRHDPLPDFTPEQAKANVDRASGILAKIGGGRS